MASWLDDLGLHELEHIKDGASAFAQELHPINSAEDFISFVVALNLYPPGTPLRAERIAGEMPAGLSAPAVRYLLKKLPIVDRLASQLRDDPSRKTVRLVPDVEHCVACGLAGEAVPLVVKWGSRCSSPTVYAEHGRLKGELNGLSCPRCSAWHSMSYAEGGTRIPAGKQVPYPGATASSRRWVQLSQSTVFENGWECMQEANIVTNVVVEKAPAGPGHKAGTKKVFVNFRDLESELRAAQTKQARQEMYLAFTKLLQAAAHVH